MEVVVRTYSGTGADKLYTETTACMRSPETLKTLTTMGVAVEVKSAPEVSKFVRD